MKGITFLDEDTIVIKTNKLEQMMEKVDEALEKAEEIAKDNPEEVRFILVQMD